MAARGARSHVAEPAAAPAALRTPIGLTPLRERNFALYWYGQAASYIGSFAEVTATSWLLYELTGSPLLLGLGGLFRAAPILALSLLGGVVADRLPRKQLLLVGQVAHVATALALGVLVATGSVAFWHIYTVNLLNGTLTAFEQPARLALYPSLVSRAQLQNAITLNSLLFRFATVVGPTFAGLLIARVDPAAPFFVNALSYLVVVATLMLIRTPPVQGPARATRAGALEGLRYAVKHPILPAVLLAESAVSLFGHNHALLTIYARDVLEVDAQGLGLMLGAVGAGALLGIGMLLAVGDILRKGAVMLIAGGAYAIAFLAFGFMPVFALAILALVLIGLADSFWGAMRLTLLQTLTEDEYRGRVMSMGIIATRGFTAASQVQTGAAVSLLGPPGAVLLGASVIAAVLAGTTVRSPRLRGYGSEPETGLHR